MAKRNREAGKTSGLRLSMRVWDLPVRLFHWSIVVLLAISYVSELKQWWQVHFLAGYAVLALLLFRAAWGFVGSDTARFKSFLVGPIHGLRHLAQFFRKEEDRQIGHNAAGGWMVLVLLALLAGECISGLFARDDDVVEGPLAHDLSGPGSVLFTNVHEVCWNLILAAVALHLLAILAYQVVKGHNLLRPMITGKKRLPATLRPPRMASPLLALLILACAAALVGVVVNVF
jgi:cytochrome b